MARLENQMEKLVGQFSDRGGDEAVRKKYYSTQRKYNQTRQQLNKAIDKLAQSQRKASAATTTRTFINGFGEATRREITTSTYKRAQKRLERAVRRNLGH